MRPREIDMRRYRRILIKIQRGICERCKEHIVFDEAEIVTRTQPRKGEVVFLRNATAVHKIGCEEKK